MTDYQARLESIVQDFGSPNGAGATVNIDNYRDKVPEAVLEFWRQYGIGVVLDGYFQFCDPATCSSIVRFVLADDPEIKAEQTHALGFGAFGTIIAWNEVHQAVNIDLVNGKVSCQSLINGELYDPNTAVTTQLMFIDDPIFDEYDAAAKKLFKRARSKIGKLIVGQIYGFKPILAFGGNRDLANLAIYDASPHMAILAQAHQFHLMDNASYPPQPVRQIGV